MQIYYCEDDKEKFPYIFYTLYLSCEKIIEWCEEIYDKEHKRYRYKVQWGKSPIEQNICLISYFKFKNKSDAMLFKLRWSNNI